MDHLTGYVVLDSGEVNFKPINHLRIMFGMALAAAHTDRTVSELMQHYEIIYKALEEVDKDEEAF